ncbi:MAG: hypothetical protein RLZ12_712 [Bacillota bacterium]
MFSGKVALVTGGATGIGKEVSLSLAKAGAKSVVFYIGSNDLAQQYLKELQAIGGEGRALEVDVTNKDQVHQGMKQIVEEFGRLDILVNNAGITADNLLLRMSEAEWERVMNVNLKGVFLSTQAALKPMLRQRSGRIINISSVVGVMGNIGQANYSATKAGLIGFTKTVAREVASRGITVNAIAPGYIDTDMTRGLNEDVKQKLLENIPLGRLGTVHDVADLITFLASDNAAYITGQNIHVDGGLAM